MVTYVKLLLYPCAPDLHRRSLAERYRAGGDSRLAVLGSKQAAWHPGLQSYVLDYRGRASQPSVKNFQLCGPGDPDTVIMQLGKVGNEEFIMDFRYQLL